MKQVFNAGGKIAVIDVPAPVCGDNEVLVQNTFSVISAGTEAPAGGQDRKAGTTSLLSRVSKNPELVKKAIDMVRKEGFGRTLKAVRGQGELGLVPLGYSSSGVVLQAGKNVTEIAVGDRVACAGAGYACHAEVIAVPRNLVCRIPDNLEPEEAAFTTLGAIAVQGIRRAQVQLGEKVAVIGLGLLGQITCQILKASGSYVIGIDPVETRVKLSEELGVDAGLVQGGQAVSQVLEHTGGTGADAVIICADTPSSEPVRQAMWMARKKGRVVVVGAVGLELERSPFYEKELDFLISCSYGPGRYDSLYEEKGVDYPLAYVRWTEKRNMRAFLDLLAGDKVNVKKLTDHVFPVEEAEKAYEVLSDAERRPIGVLFRYQPEHIVEPVRKVELKFAAKALDRIGVGIIGAGDFARAHHLPNLKRIPIYDLRAIVTKTGRNARKLAEEYGAQYCTTDYHDVLSDPEVDMVLIATRHNLHAPLAVAAAKASKHIFVEKPIAMTTEQCREVYEAVTGSGVNLTAGFNRRFSPLGQRLKRLVEKRQGPLMVTYRINSAGMNKEHWINDPVEGGGAIIGEGCHFFDFVSWLVGVEPQRIHAEMISSGNAATIDANNVVCILTFADGSVASVFYSTIGSESFSKERVEVFVDGGVIVIDDFRQISIEGLPGRGASLPRTEKGQYELLLEFGRLLKGESQNQDLPTVMDGVRATVCSLKVLDAVKSGKAQEFSYP